MLILLLPNDDIEVHLAFGYVLDEDLQVYFVKFAAELINMLETINIVNLNNALLGNTPLIWRLALNTVF